jgi:hypothetical protein
MTREQAIALMYTFMFTVFAATWLVMIIIKNRNKPR